MSEFEVDMEKLSKDVQTYSETLQRFKKARAEEPENLKQDGNNLEKELTAYGKCIRFAADTYQKAELEVRDIVNHIQIEP